VQTQLLHCVARTSFVLAWPAQLRVVEAKPTNFPYIYLCVTFHLKEIKVRKGCSTQKRCSECLNMSSLHIYKRLFDPAEQRISSRACRDGPCLPCMRMAVPGIFLGSVPRRMKALVPVTRPPATRSSRRRRPYPCFFCYRAMRVFTRSSWVALVLAYTTSSEELDTENF
jgi:hypothetical protein